MKPLTSLLAVVGLAFALAALLNESVRTTPGVRSTESWLELGVYKHAFNYG